MRHSTGIWFATINDIQVELRQTFMVSYGALCGAYPRHSSSHHRRPAPLQQPVAYVSIHHLQASSNVIVCLSSADANGRCTSYHAALSFAHYNPVSKYANQIPSSRKKRPHPTPFAFLHTTNRFALVWILSRTPITARSPRFQRLRCQSLHTALWL